MPRPFPHERRETGADEDAEELPEDHEHNDEDSDDPIEAILGIIERYYNGLLREEEGMGVD